jgi:2-polyprenyl-3-methyl-5-hydroxy-6-metoxy-1,4-benzoquinol methylase
VISKVHLSMVDEYKVKRFGFGENWLAFSEQIDHQRIKEAVRSLKELFELESFAGRTFFDIGCGSGIFSLAAHQLGATVLSIDFDMNSVTCAERLRDQFGISRESWRISQGSVLDAKLLSDFGQADLVYCWGVVHHTGNMHEAINNIVAAVRIDGSICLAIYNQQGNASKRWKSIKMAYNYLPCVLRPIYVICIAGWYELKFALARLIRRQNPLPFADWSKKKEDRGMSAWHDWVDWIGGLPFEVASPDDVVRQLRSHGFVLEKLKTVGSGWGCNEYLFRREHES